MGISKKKYHLVGIILGACILLAVVVFAAVRFLPAFRAARTLRQMLREKNIDFEVNVSLEQKQLSEQQRKFLQEISWILQTDEEACMSWKIKGHIRGAQAYAQLFCEGLDGAVTDVYVDGSSAEVNARMLYEALQHKFSAAHPFMGSLLPDWQYHDYISLEQMEGIFQVDVRSMFQQYLPEKLPSQGFLASLKLLKQMETRQDEEGRQQFAVDWDSQQIRVQAVFGPGESKELSSPVSVMDEGETEQLENLWGIIKELQAKFGKER